MRDFVHQHSIVRKIWGNADLILLVFAGGAAEFALNRAVDWLFFTGKLPADPIGRLFSTVQYAQQIVFSTEEKALQAIHRMGAIHANVEEQRGRAIPDWAYRDMLYLLIDYSERAYQLLERPLSSAERSELYDAFRRVGEGLHIPHLPATYPEWQVDRQCHIANDLVYSPHTKQLFARYEEQLGGWRYRLLLRVQALLVPTAVRRLLSLPTQPLLASTLWLYPALNRVGLRPLMQRLLLPTEYLDDVRRLDKGARGI